MTMQEKLYVGNLSFNTTEKSLEELFGRYGTILSVKIIRDKITNQSRGFGFVELQNISDILSTIKTKNAEKEDLKRRYLEIKQDIHDIKKNIFGAIKRSNIKGWEKDN